MKNDFHSNRKILTKMVISLVVFVLVYFVVTLILMVRPDAVPTIVLMCLPQTIAGICAFFSISSEIRNKLLLNKDAYFIKRPYYIIFVILLAVSLTVVFNFLFSLIPWDIFGTKNVVQDNDTFYSYPLLLRIIVFVILVPISEEILFRGVIYSHLKSIIPYWAAALMTGAVFGIYHGNLMQGIYAFFMGTIMCLILHYGGTFAYPVLFHLIANLISNLCYEYVNINKVVYSPVFITLSFVYLVVAIIFSYVFKNRLTLKDK